YQIYPLIFSFSLLMLPPPPTSTLFPYTTLFRSLTFVAFFAIVVIAYWSMRSWNARKNLLVVASYIFYGAWNPPFAVLLFSTTAIDRKSTRLNSSHVSISYAVFCLKKKTRYTRII